MSSNTASAFLVDVAVSAGNVTAVGPPVPLLVPPARGGAAAAADPHAAAVALATRLAELGVLGESNWARMLEVDPSGERGLVEVVRQGPLALSGVICASGLYSAETETCAWEPARPSEAEAEAEAAAAAADNSAPTECPLCAYIKGGGCKEEFLPFQACIQKAAETDEEPNCMGLFDAVAKCMVATEANKAYYAGFISDFPHLFGKEGERVAKAVAQAKAGSGEAPQPPAT